ncbi:hypothetical protein JYK14_09045 [Siccirubricoccus sp. KC 17139]|uniref:FUSC family protein n=1 Tax=Siccirubricoccus soli TaxID=2899147 RepID=A0ABT1D3W5_9PROT|nr:hypothetical protein [Siccirubricoccus soli]MCO6416312.1 hypothetical protein [Siccirubricoccus soli]MCP2682446.1 hypothetical protein [Siccirubricoccus soli]
MPQRVLGAWIGLRGRWRGYGLPIFASPLLLSGLLGAIGGEEKIALGSALGFGLTLLAARVLRRGREGDIRRASWLVAVATGLAAHYAADLGSIFPFILALGALYGTRLSYRALPEAPAPEPPPPPEPPSPVAESRARLARVQDEAARLQVPGLRDVASAMGGVLDDLDAHPDRLPQARRFLAVHLDGLERITGRLAAGATPPATLDPLLAELTRAAGELRETLRRHETENLEIQVKVLSDRLREEGFR